MTRTTTLACCALWAASLASSSLTTSHAPPTPTARVKNGTYVGVHAEGYNQDFFLGIPYAQPPVGSLRFRNPASLNESWSEERLATQHRSACYGYGSDQWNYAVSEDCLHVNVVRPSGYEDEKLPVALWIHGGGFFQGSGVDQRYNSSFMVENSVRIGKVSDPKQVTIFGESAGAGAVGFHLTAYGGRDDNLFRGAIMQSGGPVHYQALVDPLGNRETYNTVVNRTVCANASSPLECLRYLPAEQLNTAINTTSMVLNTTAFQPVVDGDFIRKRTSLQMAAGEFVHVPIIAGANSDEGSAFSPRPVNTTEQLFGYMTSGQRGNVSAEFANQLLAAYPNNDSVSVITSLGNLHPGPAYGSQWRRSASYFGDQTFIANRRLTCQTWAAANVTAYCYRFNAIPAGIPSEIGATHFQEIGFVWLNLEGVGYVPASAPPFSNKTENYATLARFMDSTWVSFVHDLDPNSWRASYAWNGTEAMWPRYDLSNPLDYVFDANVSSFAEADTYRKEGMDLINAHAYDVYGR